MVVVIRGHHLRREKNYTDMEEYYYADRVLRIEERNGQLIMEVTKYGGRSGNTTRDNRGQQEEEKES